MRKRNLKFLPSFYNLNWAGYSTPLLSLFERTSENCIKIRILYEKNNNCRIKWTKTTKRQRNVTVECQYRHRISGSVINQRTLKHLAHCPRSMFYRILNIEFTLFTRRIISDSHCIKLLPVAYLGAGMSGW